MFTPHHARQIGPRKVQLFGVQVDGVLRQYNYLVDEIGKHIETYIYVENSELTNAIRILMVLQNCPPPPFPG